MKTPAFLCLALAIAGCASDRSAQNIRGVTISKWTHLSAADQEQIVRLVRAKTRQPIQGITRWKPDSEQIAVFTGFAGADIYVNPWTEFQLEKRANRWNIVGQDIISPGMASMLLSYPPNDTTNQKRPNHAMERTPERCAFTFQMTSTLSVQSTLALVRRRSSCSR